MRAESAPASMLAAASLAALLAACSVMHAAAAVPAACTTSPMCNLSQCPCYGKQVDNGQYARPPGCFAQARPTCILPAVSCPSHAGTLRVSPAWLMKPANTAERNSLVCATCCTAVVVPLLPC